jgi:hypothetical protein
MLGLTMVDNLFHEYEMEMSMKIITVSEDWYMRTYKCSLTEARKALARQEQERLKQCHENAKAVPAVKWY